MNKWQVEIPKMVYLVQRREVGNGMHLDYPCYTAMCILQDLGVRTVRYHLPVWLLDITR